MLETLQKEYENSADEHAVEKRLLYSRAQWLSLDPARRIQRSSSGVFRSADRSGRSGCHRRRETGPRSRDPGGSRGVRRGDRGRATAVAREVRGRRRVVAEIPDAAAHEPQGIFRGARQAFRRTPGRLEPRQHGLERRGSARPGARERRRAGDRAVSARPRRGPARQPQRIGSGVPRRAARRSVHRSRGEVPARRRQVQGVRRGPRSSGQWRRVGPDDRIFSGPDVDIRRTSASRSAPGRPPTSNSPP